MTTYRVVGTGDSILGMALGINSPGGALLSGDDVWIDCEYGRNAYSVGLQNRASTASIWNLVLTRSEPAGWIVLQDNGLGTTDSAWSILMQDIYDDLPTDRTLVAVLPGFRSDISSTSAATCVLRARAMMECFYMHPKVVFVHLNQYVLRNPGHFADGQHPNTIAQTWLYNQIDSWVNLP